MANKSNLVTLREKIQISNNFSSEKKGFLLNYNLSQKIKQFFIRKKILSTNQKLQLSFGNVFIELNLFFKSIFLHKYKKRLKKKIKNKNLNQKEKKSNKQLNNIDERFKFKKLAPIFIKKILNHHNQHFQIKNVMLNAKILNKSTNKKICLLIYHRIKRFKTRLFNRQRFLFFDFILLSSLYAEGKVSLDTYLSVFCSIFKNLEKKRHTLFFAFSTEIFKVLIDHLRKKRLCTNIKGIQLILNGRLKGKTRAKKLIIRVGSVSLQSFNKTIEYSKNYAFTNRFGVFGFKAWVYKKKLIN
jgi:hypothetical protein